jgi:hypothetical protein
MNPLKSFSHLRSSDNIRNSALLMIQNLKCENGMASGGMTCLSSFTKIIKVWGGGGGSTHRHRPRNSHIISEVGQKVNILFGYQYSLSFERNQNGVSPNELAQR